MGEKVTIQHIIEQFSGKLDIPVEHAEAFIKAFFELIIEGLEKDRYVKIKGLGAFKLVNVDSRESINVNTGERFEIQSYTKVTFVPENTLRDRVNKPFAHFETVILNDGVAFDGENEEVKKEDNTQIVGEPIVSREELQEEKVNEESIPVVDDGIAPTIVAETAVLSEEVEGIEEVASMSLPMGANEDISSSPALIKKRKRKRRRKEVKRGSKLVSFLIVSILVVLVACGVLICYPDVVSDFNRGKKKTVDKVPVAVVASEGAEENLDESSLLMGEKDTVKVVAVALPKEEKPKGIPITSTTPVETKPKAASAAEIPLELIPVKPDSTSYKIVGTKATYTLRAGETLTRVAYRFYGTKDLWPYLLMHNRDVIKNPNIIPSGITLKIPELQEK